jgi:hypothetical protein
MSGNSTNQFTVSQWPKVKAQAKALTLRAIALGLTQEVESVFEEMYLNLQTRPLEWGKPLYHTKLPGGVVCMRIVRPLVVHYAVYPEERVVCITDIASLPRHPLAES